MNLYSFHINPAILDGYDTARLKVPELAIVYAREVGKPVPECEPAIAKNGNFSFDYAKNILKGRFPAGELAIISSPPYTAYTYARDILHAPWPEAEDHIATNTFSSFYYARDVIKGRFLLGEPVIKQDNKMWELYIKAMNTLGDPVT